MEMAKCRSDLTPDAEKYLRETDSTGILIPILCWGVGGEIYSNSKLTIQFGSFPRGYFQQFLPGAKGKAPLGV